MNCVILIGIPATGKSSFFKERFVDTHVRINLDMLRTRKREERLVAACLEADISFVLDNTNPAKSTRGTYLALAKAKGVSVVGYYFSSHLEVALRRNSQRQGKACIADAGVRYVAARLELPSMSEGFDELYHVTLTETGFSVSEWKDVGTSSSTAVTECNAQSPFLKSKLSCFRFDRTIPNDVPFPRPGSRQFSATPPGFCGWRLAPPRRTGRISRAEPDGTGPWDQS
jgi:tRNA uridine 5-carbamoylmethylation protein Kti12